jgi:hypothetical protein
MSTENQPSEILPTYLPYGWTADNQGEYVKFPVAQSANITFPLAISTNNINGISGSSVSIPSAKIGILNAIDPYSVSLLSNLSGNANFGKVGSTITFLSSLVANSVSYLNLYAETLYTSTIYQNGPLGIAIYLYNTSSGIINLGQVCTTLYLGGLTTRTVISNIDSQGETESISIGGNQTSGVINIGSSPTRNGIITMGSGGTVNVNANMNFTENNILKVKQIQSISGPINIQSSTLLITSDTIFFDGIVKAPTQSYFSYPYSNEIVATVRTVFNILEQYAVARTSAINIFPLIQTFVSGIITNTVSAYSASTDASIFTNSTGNITIGGGSAEIIMGPTPRIRQVLKVATVQVENVVGNASELSSMSTTFNFKNTSSNLPLNCYNFYTTFADINQYCELVVSGCNNAVGGYSAKFIFSLNVGGGVWSVKGLTPLYQSYPVVGVSFTFTSNTATLTVSTTTNNLGQTYFTTLTAYPTCYVGVNLYDYSITAI